MQGAVANRLQAIKRCTCTLENTASSRQRCLRPRDATGSACDPVLLKGAETQLNFARSVPGHARAASWGRARSHRNTASTTLGWAEPYALYEV